MFYGKARHLFRICHDGVWLISKPDSEDFGEPLPWQQCNSNLTFSPRTRAPSDPEACDTFGMVTPGLQSPSASVVLPTCYPERSNKETCYLFTRQIKQANIIVNWKISSKTKTNKNSGKKTGLQFFWYYRKLFCGISCMLMLFNQTQSHKAASITVSVNIKSIAKNHRSNTTVIHTCSPKRGLHSLFSKAVNFSRMHTHRHAHTHIHTVAHSTTCPPLPHFTYFSAWFKTIGWDEHSKELYDWANNFFYKMQYVMIWGTLFLTINFVANIVSENSFGHGVHST